MKTKLSKARSHKHWRLSETKLVRKIDPNINKHAQITLIAQTIGRSKSAVMWKYYKLGVHKLKRTSKPSIDTTVKPKSKLLFLPNQTDNTLKFKIKNIRIENDYLIIKY